MATLRLVTLCQDAAGRDQGHDPGAVHRVPREGGGDGPAALPPVPLRRGWKEMPPWVFCSDVGTPLDHANVEKARACPHPAHGTYLWALAANGEPGRRGRVPPKAKLSPPRTRGD